MDNMERIIDAHNKKILQKTTPAADNCNCKNLENCPLSGNCRTKNILNKADVTSKQESNVYIGLCETEFKTRYNNVNLRVLVEKFTPRIVYVKSGVDFYAQTSFHQKSHENCDR